MFYLITRKSFARRPYWIHLFCFYRAQNWPLFHHPKMFLKCSWSTVSLSFVGLSVLSGSFIDLRLFFAVPRGVLFGCGDLIFSSHMIFTLVFVRTYHKYGSKRYWNICVGVCACNICIWFRTGGMPAYALTCSSIIGGSCFSRLIKLFAWLMAIIQSLLIIASRKHYTVDVVVAW